MPTFPDPDAHDDDDTLERKARTYAATGRPMGRPVASAPLGRAPKSEPLGRLRPALDPLRKADGDTDA